MAKVISIINLKGGVGKTTTAHALSSGLLKRGYKVLAIDLDPQRNLSYCYNVLKAGTTSYELLARQATIEQCIITTTQGEIIPAGERLTTAKETLKPTPEGLGFLLARSIEPIKENYDYIIIDTPPAINILTTNALMASNECIISTQADVFSLQGIGQMTRYLKELKARGLKATVKGILFNRYNGRQNITKALEEIIKQTGDSVKIPVFNTKIRECVAFKKAQAKKSNIYQVAPHSNATADFESFIDELLGE